MKVLKATKKPVTIEAIQLEGSKESFKDVLGFIGTESVSDLVLEMLYVNQRIAIDTFEGTVYASIGDYVIKGVKGEFYPCRKDIFKETYTTEGTL